MAERYPGDSAAANGFGRRHLHEDEARLLYEADYPAPPDMRVPGSWKLSTGRDRPHPLVADGGAAERAEVRRRQPNVVEDVLRASPRGADRLRQRHHPPRPPQRQRAA